MDNLYGNLSQFHFKAPLDRIEEIDEILEPMVVSLSWDSDGNIEGVADGAFKEEIERIIPYPLSWNPLDNKDWLKEQEEALPPLEIGSFFLFGPHYEGSVPNGKIPLKLHSSHAFGSGHHTTTKNCLLLIDTLDHVQKMLDVGCGSGVLGLAAQKKFSAKVLACDIDPQSVQLAKENGLEKVIESDGLAHPAILKEAPYDLITANIHSKPLCGMASNIAKVSSGRLILSGILDEQFDEVLSAYVQFKVLERVVDEGWVTLLLEKK